MDVLLMSGYYVISMLPGDVPESATLFPLKLISKYACT